MDDLKKGDILETEVVTKRTDGSYATITRIRPLGVPPVEPPPVEPPPVEPPPVEPPPPMSPAMAVITSLLGPTLTAAQALAKGWNALDAYFAKWEPIRWGDFTGQPTDATRWSACNYYDRAAIYYVMHARTGVQDYKHKGDAIAVNYRDQYLVPNNYQHAIWWYQHDGLALHYLFTGDRESRHALMKSSEASAGYMRYINDRRAASFDTRNKAKLLSSLLIAHQVATGDGLGATYPFADALTKALPAILLHQDDDGAWRDANRCGKQAHFMAGMLCDSLIRIHKHFPLIGDAMRAEIVRAVEHSCRFVYDNWSRVTPSGYLCFTYIEDECLSNGDALNVKAPDLTGFWPHVFAWVASQGATRFDQVGHDLLMATILTAYPQGSKQWNQSLTNSWKTLGYLR